MFQSLVMITDNLEPSFKINLIGKHVGFGEHTDGPDALGIRLPCKTSCLLILNIIYTISKLSDSYIPVMVRTNKMMQSFVM